MHAGWRESAANALGQGEAVYPGGLQPLQAGVSTLQEGPPKCVNAFFIMLIARSLREQKIVTSVP